MIITLGGILNYYPLFLTGYKQPSGARGPPDKTFHNFSQKALVFGALPTLCGSETLVNGFRSQKIVIFLAG